MPPETLAQQVNSMLIKYGGLVTTTEEAYRLKASFMNLFQNETNVAELRRLLDTLEEIVCSKSSQVCLVVRDITTAYRYITTRKLEIDQVTEELKIHFAALSKIVNPVELEQVIHNLESLKTCADRTFQTVKSFQQALVRRLHERINDLTSFTNKIREYPLKIAEVDTENEKVLTQLKLVCATRESFETQLAGLVQKVNGQNHELKRQIDEKETASARIAALIVSKDAADAEILRLEALEKSLELEVDAVKIEVDAVRAETEKTLLAACAHAQTALSKLTISVEAKKLRFDEIKKRHDDSNTYLKDITDEEISVDLKLQKETLDIAETLTKITQQESNYQAAKLVKEQREREQFEVMEAERRVRQEQARVAAEKAEAERQQREEEARVQAEKDRRLAEFEAKEAAEQERKQKIREKRLKRKQERDLQHSKHDTASDYHSDTSSVNLRHSRSSPFSSKKLQDVKAKLCVFRKTDSVVSEDEHPSSENSDEAYIPTPEKRKLKKKRRSSSEHFVPESQSVEDKKHPETKNKQLEVTENSLDPGLKNDKTPIKKENVKTDFESNDTLEVFKSLTKVDTPVPRRKAKTVLEEEAQRAKSTNKERTSHKSKFYAAQDPMFDTYSMSRRPQRASTRTAQRNIQDQLKQLQMQFSDDEKEDKNAYVPKIVNFTPDKKSGIKKSDKTPDKVTVKTPNKIAPVSTNTPEKPSIPKQPTKSPKDVPPPIQISTVYTEAEMSFWDC